MSETRAINALATRQEVADRLGVPPTTLSQWAHRGEGPKYRRIGRHARYDWADVEKWLREQPVHGGGAVA